MTKPKHRQLVRKPAKDSINGVHELDLPLEDSWVMVKKQKVNIWIPSLPVDKQMTITNPGESQPELQPELEPELQPELEPEPEPEPELELEPIQTSTQVPCPIVNSLQMPSVFDRDKSISLAPEKAFPTARKDSSSQTIPICPPLPRPVHRMGSENPQVNRVPCHKTLGVCSASKLGKRSMSFLDRGVLLNQRLRASNLERKLQRAGGLSRWLTSLGLDRFVKMFQGKSVNKFMLANLTMKKLKDMGADAVGPRRKLMHAIECLCQPYCFEA
ncbi:unnamed protein product [Ilex paraguariensis]|uniref:SAM domain-containing protein n=1 Tax=Ilex paraguariensis TaxID=185542 RepID=A0ABC8SQC6_9AQUA